MAENHDGLQIIRKSKWKMPLGVFFEDARHVFKFDKLGKEILGIAFPAALAVAADPIASLIDTAFVGHIGPVELAAVGVSIAIFNQASRITIFPLVSITTSFVAEEDTIRKAGFVQTEAENSKKIASSEISSDKEAIHAEDDKTQLEDATKCAAVKQDSENGEKKKGYFVHDLENGEGEKENSDKLEKNLVESNEDEEALQKEEDKKTDTSKLSSLDETLVVKTKKAKRHIASASTALIFGAILGLLQAVFLIFGAEVLLSLMGVKHSSPMLAPARKYLVLRSIGAPAVLLSLAMQGIFRGFKDTTTPLYVILLGYTTNIILDPILIFVCGLGVRGAAIAHVLSQYLIVMVLLWRLMQKVDLLPPSLKDLQFGRFLKYGGLLLARVVAVTFCVTLAASMAARLGATPMAAFQTCLQVWMTSSLLSDGLAVSGQALLACAFAEKDLVRTTAIATRVLQMSFILGTGLALFVGVGMFLGAGVFTRDIHVQHLIHIGIPFIAATQPINSLAFVFDGVNFGASDFAYSAYSLVLVAIASIVSLFMLSKSNGFVGIWTALTIYMALRTFAGVWRMGTGTGPWRYLRGQMLPK